MARLRKSRNQENESARKTADGGHKTFEKERITREDGRYLILYTFPKEKKTSNRKNDSG